MAKVNYLKIDLKLEPEKTSSLFSVLHYFCGVWYMNFINLKI